ncbi:TlpA family protein disulfide reductase [Confluentibacter citreus]|uniref:TlpA family protein disulfide reductase n=1 Tax=Confluentibacter citreus TaxID=2007307 RepID=UPI000C2859C3|nr:TlpA disulfide reductase family protein [Confluentibacter citreus]
MRKLFILVCTFALLISCKEEPKNYVTFSGQITNKNSDSLIIRSSYSPYSKTIHLKEDGSFSDTLKVETGFYNLYDGNESTNLFLRNGFNITVTINTDEFDESITYSGNGAEHSNFIAKEYLLQEKLLNLDELIDLDSTQMENRFLEIKNELMTYYNSNKAIDTLITNKYINDVDPMLKPYKTYLADAIALRTNFPKGAPSPTFENYENYNGSKTSLADLKGKYVYVDVWATWCGPCKVEIPSLKQLEKDYHNKNIQFVSISIDDDQTHQGSWDKAKASWKAMIADKDLGGIQIFAPNGWQSDFVRNYKINGIPRFILIDPNGNIVSADAPRPSDPKLLDLFNELSI